MANFMEKIGEKLHMGGKKEGEQHAGEPPYAGAAPVEVPGYGGKEQHGSHPEQGCEGHGVAVGEKPKEGLLEKVKNKVKGKKQDGGDCGSSSSESDGEGARRKKKH